VWGSFQQLSIHSHQQYARAYWRYLLGWEYPPARSRLPSEVSRRLRQLAREEVKQYLTQAQRQGGKMYEFTQPKAEN